MPKLLRIDSSPRTEGSHSRRLADDVVRRWSVANPGGTVVVRDLAVTPVPHLDQAVLAGFLDPGAELSDAARAQVALSQELIDELKSADEVLVSAPMYNFTVPSVLKAWIDHIVRYGQTFDVTPEGGYVGLLKTRVVWVATAAGAFYSDGPLARYNHLNPYLETLFRFLGVQDVKNVVLENTATTPEALAASRSAADAQLRELLGEA